MVNNLDALELQLNKYMECINSTTNLFKDPNRHDFILETNMTDCEKLQLFRSGFNIQELSYRQVCNLSWMLTKSLKAPINYDNYVYWTWCGFVANFFRNKSNNTSQVHRLFADPEWINAFNALIIVPINQIK